MRCTGGAGDRGAVARLGEVRRDGVVERAVADVMRRAQKSAGRYACGIRGSSLVMQVEQALGVGSGALRGHGSQIQSLARAKGRMPPRQRA